MIVSACIFAYLVAVGVAWSLIGRFSDWRNPAYEPLGLLAALLWPVALATTIGQALTKGVFGMSKVLLGIGIVALFGLMTCGGACGSYNAAVALDEQAGAAWGQIETSVQRRADLIPNLVEVVKGYAGHENATLKAVVEARAKATAMTLDPSKATPRQMAEWQAAQGGLSQALGRLMMITEQYPNLKADARFGELQAQLEGTENRIAVARRDYNEAARSVNGHCRSLPLGVFMCPMAKVRERPYFEADAASKAVPKVKF